MTAKNFVIHWKEVKIMFPFDGGGAGVLDWLGWVTEQGAGYMCQRTQFQIHPFLPNVVTLNWTL